MSTDRVLGNGVAEPTEGALCERNWSSWFLADNELAKKKTLTRRTAATKPTIALTELIEKGAGDVPLDVIDNPVALQTLEDYLERIEYGISEPIALVWLRVHMAP
ncbi:hypothetical protein [Pseudomonas typographi]|uniref:hypothetical protein n=1 Tax=Pseudomonas typographi TaxID=2715964 RepID=UPI003084102D